MARPVRIEYHGAVYHIKSGGIARERIYLEGVDYVKFLDCLCSVIKMIQLEAHVRYGYTLKDIAEHLDVHYATISRAVKRIEERR